MAIKKYKFIQSHPAFSYFAGDVCALEDATAKTLLDGGFIAIVMQESGAPAGKGEYKKTPAGLTPEPQPTPPHENPSPAEIKLHQVKKRGRKNK